MSLTDILSMLASVASFILSAIAIWLSITFFKMSSQLSESTKEAAKGIGASVERLENLFDKLYSDTFSMMRDTVSDMRRHIWPEIVTDVDDLAEEVDSRADKKISTFRDNVEAELSQLLLRQRIQDNEVSSLRSEMMGLVDRAVQVSREATSEAREETLREYILKAIRTTRRREGKVTADSLVSRLDYSPQRVLRELEVLANEGQIAISDSNIGPETLITLNYSTGSCT